MHLDLTSSFAGMRLGALLRGLTRTGWPVFVGLLAAVCGLTMLVAAWYFDHQAHLLRSSDVSAQFSEPNIRQFARATEPVFSVPDDSSHIDDLGHLFKLAKLKGVHISTVEYSQEQSPSLQVLVRTLDIRINEDYPKLKGFVAELLGNMPHASLQEIRIDRKDAVTLQGQILLKLAFVYRVSGAPSSLIRAQP